MDFATFFNTIQESFTQRWLAWLMVLLFFVWGGISYQWYTCGIKGFCPQETTQVMVGGKDFIKINKTN
jgi:hypothetical protein